MHMKFKRNKFNKMKIFVFIMLKVPFRFSRRSLIVKPKQESFFFKHDADKGKHYKIENTYLFLENIFFIICSILFTARFILFLFIYVLCTKSSSTLKT